MVRFTDLNGYKKNLKKKDDSQKEGKIPENKEPLSLRQVSSKWEVKGPDQTKISESREDLYETAVIYMEDVLSNLREKGSFSFNEGFRIIERIVSIREMQDALYIKALHFEKGMKFLANHSVNVAVYSIKMASGLGLSREQQLEIGIAGLFHDVGMCKVPEEIIYKKNKLTDREFQIVKKHPNFGYELLNHLVGQYSYLAECALQEHERIDGSGYPKGLKGDEVHEFARIIGLVDVYEALTHSRPQRERLLHFTAVKEIIQSNKRAFQRNHLKSLLNIFSIFPINSYVKLNSKAIGKVIETHQEHPMRPKLQIIYDSHGKPLFTERIVNLPENPLLYVVEPVSEEELEKLPKVN